MSGGSLHATEPAGCSWRRLRRQAAERCACASHTTLRVLTLLSVSILLTLVASPVAGADATIWAPLSRLLSRDAGGESEYPVYDSRTVVLHDGPTAPGFYWINNNELLFIGMQLTPDPTAPNKERVRYSLGRWHTQTGVVTLLRNFGPNRPFLCFFDGYVKISVRIEGDLSRVYHGPLGAEREDDPKRRYNVHVCRPADQLPVLPKWTEGRDVRWLESLDAGFVDFGDRQKAHDTDKIRLYRHGAKSDEGIELPLYRGRVSHRFPYYAFKDAFFVESYYYRHPRPKDVSYPVFWLYRDGRVEKIAEIPWGPWRSGGSFITYPTRTGVLMASSNARTSTDLGNAGLYLLRGATVERILRGWIEGLGVAVSPDGCKAAFAYSPIVTRKNNVLRVLDVCEAKS